MRQPDGGMRSLGVLPSERASVSLSDKRQA
jgi:hypothetical protein